MYQYSVSKESVHLSSPNKKPQFAYKTVYEQTFIVNFMTYYAELG